MLKGREAVDRGTRRPCRIVAADLDDRFRLGSEYRAFKKLLALRAGLQQDFYTKENMTFSFGIGLDIPLWVQTIRFDYAYTDTPTLPNTHRTSLSFLINHRSKYPLAIGLAFLSGPVAAQGDPTRAVQLLGASDALLDAMGLGPERSDKAEIDHIMNAVREQLDAESFNAAWENGQAMSLEQAVAFALERVA